MRNIRTIIMALLAAALLLSGCVMRPQGTGDVLRENAADFPSPEPEAARYSIEFRRGDEVLSAQSVEEGSLPDVPAGAGNVRLLGWTDGSGSRADPFVPADRDAVYYADTRPLLAADSGWLQPREYGFLMPEAAFTRGDALATLDVLLADSADAEPITAEWSTDAGETQPMTAEEFRQLLYALFEISDADSLLSEAVLPGAETVTRAQAAYCLSRLLDAEREKQSAAVAAERKSQVGTGDRSERIRTYNYPQGRVTDHRIGLTLYKIEQILNGDLDEIIDALVTADQAEKLRATSEL